jgi:hypothetical protein
MAAAASGGEQRGDVTSIEKRFREVGDRVRRDEGDIAQAVLSAALQASFALV